MEPRNNTAQPVAAVSRRGRSRATSPRPSFITQVRVDHGPAEVLGTFFLKADDVLKRNGITLALASIDELIDLNRANRDSWRPIVPMYERQSGFADDQTACLLAYDSDGRAVGAMAARIFDWRQSSFHEEAHSMRLFYARPEDRSNLREACEVSAPSAKTLSGRVALCGATWWHPSIRGRYLSQAAGRVLRAYALTRWDTELSIGMMAKDLIEKGVAKSWGYTHQEFGVTFRNFAIGPFYGALIWMTADELIADLPIFMRELDLSVENDRINRRA